jgi:transcriptional regulator with XRE-family HTH domain
MSRGEYPAIQATAVRATPAVPFAAGTGVTGIGRPSLVPAGSRSVEDVNPSSEVREFLVTRRARITPQQAGLPTYGANRRVKGLRREEVAMLAGVSVDYYTRLERGNLAGASESVLDALARALQLDEAERAHLFDLARAAHGSSGGARRPANTARFTFLSPQARDFYRDWDRTSRDMVAVLRAAAGRDPYDKGPVGPGRRAVHPQRCVPLDVGRARRAVPPHRP